MANRLAHETSPYLLQHADNPVDWHPWSPEALEAAKRADKPIFLSVGYSACHWCHVMEHESFEDEATARVMNDHFVCIKVDREERPDVDDIYMTAVQLLTGGGGWPMSVWLTPEREPFFGGTYFPPRDGVRGAARGFLGMVIYYSWVQELFGGKRYQKFDVQQVSRTMAEIWLRGMQTSSENQDRVSGNGHKNGHRSS